MNLAEQHVAFALEVEEDGEQRTEVARLDPFRLELVHRVVKCVDCVAFDRERRGPVGEDRATERSHRRAPAGTLVKDRGGLLARTSGDEEAPDFGSRVVVVEETAREVARDVWVDVEVFERLRVFDEGEVVEVPVRQTLMSC